MSRGSVLTRQQLRELKAELLSEMTRLERALEADVETDAPVWAGGTAVATLAGRGVGGLAQTHAHARYDAIVNALRRLATGSYGTCEGCKSPIPYGRLIVMPEALRCITCGPAG